MEHAGIPSPEQAKTELRIQTLTQYVCSTHACNTWAGVSICVQRIYRYHFLKCIAIISVTHLDQQTRR